MAFVPGEGRAPQAPSLFNFGSVSSSVGNQATGSSGGASVHVLHPQQFRPGVSSPLQQMPLHERLKNRGQIAKGMNPMSASHQGHTAQDILSSGQPIAQNQVRSVSSLAPRQSY
jgi:hypothetical protein